MSIFAAMENASLWKIFGVFLKMGAFTIGGGYVMIPLIEKEITRRGWIPEDEMEDMIVLAQSAPGVLAVNMAIFTGHRLRGTKGSLVATLGAVLPSFVIILAIAIAFASFKDNKVIQSIFQGIRPAAVALILVPAVNMARSGCKKPWAWAVALGTLLLVAFLKVSPIWIILVIIVGVSSIAYLKQKDRL